MMVGLVSKGPDARRAGHRSANPVVVLGAGPAGIGTALALGRAATVIEGRAAVAGLSRSLVFDGAVFDLGGHSFHTPHPDVRDLVFGALPMEEQRRDAWCWRAGDWIAYPFQKNVGQISDPVVRDACLAGMACAGDAEHAANFDDYLDRRFGTAVADAFMRPYNRKMWGRDLARLSTSWTGQRIAGPRGSNEVFLTEGGERHPLQSDTTVAYPTEGGFGTIFEALSRDIADLRIDSAVVGIDVEHRTLSTRAGDTIAWERIVSTLPLPNLIRLLSRVPDAVSAKVSRLEAIPVGLVMVVLEGRGPVDRQRVYCSEPDLVGHKIVLNHTSSRWLRQRPRHGIQVEVSLARDHGPDVVDQVVDDLLRLRLLRNRSEVRRIEYMRLPNGYPVPTHERDAFVSGTRDWLADRGIHLCGRFAEWAYINADEALARGLALGKRLADGHAS